MQVQKNYDLTEGSIWRHMLFISTPAMLGHFFNSFYNWIDSFWGGRIGIEALTAFSLTFPIFLLSIAASYLVSSGTTVLISNALGEKSEEKAKLYLEKAFTLSIIVGIFIMFLVKIVSPQILKGLGASGEVFIYSVRYIDTLAYGMPFLIVSMTLNAKLISGGNAKFLRNIFIMNTIINIWLDPVLMYGIQIQSFTLIPSMGITGIALSTVLVQALGFVLILYKVVKDGSVQFGKIKNFIISFKESCTILWYGTPTFLQIATASMGLFVVNFFLTRLGNSSVVAAYGIGLRIEQFALIPSLGIKMALSAMVGQNNGAKKYDRIKKILGTALFFAIVMQIVVMLPIVIFGEHIAKIFSQDGDVVVVTGQYLWFAFCSFFAYQMMSFSSSILQGMKKPIVPMVLLVIRQTILPLIFISLFAYVLSFGIYGVFLSVVTCAWIIAIILLVFTLIAIKNKMNMNKISL